MAAEQGAALAQYNLGVMYRLGKGVPQDSDEAQKWYRKAAEQGHVKAQNALGSLYDKGRDVPQDFVKAHKWYNLAATHGDVIARKNRDILAKKMTPADISKAQKLYREWRVKHGKI